MASPKSKDKTVSVRALVVVNYDGTLYGPGQEAGDTFDCRETDLSQLRDVNAVEAVATAAAAQ
jgi:hypothetical protein